MLLTDAPNLFFVIALPVVLLLIGVAIGFVAFGLNKSGRKETEQRAETDPS